MVICGNIFIRNNYEDFVLACLDCGVEISIESWQEFVLHVRYHKKPPEFVENDVTGVPSMACNSINAESTVFRNESDANEDCLAETAFVGLPISDNEDSVGAKTDEDEMPALSSSTANESDTEKTSYAPTAKFNPTFYRRSPRITTFVELYKAQPCLWDPKCESFKSKEKRALAYSFLIDQLKSTINVHITHFKLKKCIANLHTQYAAITRQKRTQKLSRVPLHYHELYSFLGLLGDAVSDTEEDSEEDKIKLVFTKTNQITTLFINLYSKYPQLYDSAHDSFSNIDRRKAAYVEMAKQLCASVSQYNITHNDVYDSVQRLRQWYCRKIKGLTEVQSDGLLKSEKLYIEKCKGFMTSITFRQKLVCEICKNSFSTDHALQAHLYREHKLGEWPFQCDLCDSGFERRCHLQQHNQRVHVGKLFQCKTCDRSFAFLSHLNTHMRTHDEKYIAKPFVCEFCGKSFKQKIQMSNHVTAVHTKIRAFKCDRCPKDFLTKRDLKDHIKAHLNIRDKVCEICDKAFTNANALVKHRHIHKEKTLQCTLCSTKFSERVSLGVHMKRTHKIIRNT